MSVCLKILYCGCWKPHSSLIVFKEFTMHWPIVSVDLNIFLYGKQANCAPPPLSIYNNNDATSMKVCAIIHTNALWVFYHAASLYYMSVLYLIFFLWTICVTLCENIVFIWVHRDFVRFTYVREEILKALWGSYSILLKHINILPLKKPPWFFII